jgi:hypothetical protein
VYALFEPDSPYAGWTMSVCGPPDDGRVDELAISAVAAWAGDDEDRWRPWRAGAYVRPGQPGYRRMAAALDGGQVQWAAALDWLVRERAAVVATVPRWAPGCRRHDIRPVPAALAAQRRPGQLVLVCPRVACRFTRIIPRRGTLRR